MSESADRMALREALQAFVEIEHASKNPQWFTKGEQAALEHSYTWRRRGISALQLALAKPDPCEALAIELRDMRRRFHACCVHSGSEKEFADAACEKADAALAAYEAGK